jgi:hypothetical protein
MTSLEKLPPQIVNDFLNKELPDFVISREVRDKLVANSKISLQERQQQSDARRDKILNTPLP